MDGFETCRTLKKTPDLSHIPVVLVTALPEDTDRLKGFEAGAADVLTKPISDTVLFARIQALLQVSRSKNTMIDSQHAAHDNPTFGVLRLTRKRFEEWGGVLVAVCIIVGLWIWRAQNPVIRNPEAEKAAREKVKAENMERNLKYEADFLEHDTDPTILGRVRTPTGGIVTGRLLFIPVCPEGHWCVQPDMSITDEHGDDITEQPEPEPPGN